MFRVCMSVCLAGRAGSYVCTYGSILRIRLTEEYQLVQNKQVLESNKQCTRLVWLFLILGPCNIGPNTTETHFKNVYRHIRFNTVSPQPE